MTIVFAIDCVKAKTSQTGFLHTHRRVKTPHSTIDTIDGRKFLFSTIFIKNKIIL